jgi:hypothetical protein
MPDGYRYIDPDYTYANPQTDVLRNLVNVADHSLLLIFVPVFGIPANIAYL